MPESIRSPFGAILREERKAQRVSQSELALRIQKRFDTDPSVAELGVLSDRAIANIEAPKASASEWVRPRPETVQVLLLGLDIDPESERAQTFQRAAERTRLRETPVTNTNIDQNALPFVHGGREAQWASLMEAWQQASAGQPGFRLISGSAGAGKTRLVEEFCDHVRSSRPELLIAWGECASGAASIEPYLPFRQAITAVLKRDSEEPGESPVEPDHVRVLLDSVRQLGGVLMDVNALKSWLALRAPQHLPELQRLRESYSPTDTVGRFDQLMVLASSIARDVPLILVLEDLHWADESTCSLLLFMQRQMRHHTDLPLLVIGTCRSSDLNGDGDRHPMHKVINELGRQLESFILEMDSAVGTCSGEVFVHELIGSFGLPPTDHVRLAETLYGRTQGHPLFTTELLQRLVTTGELKFNGSQSWELATTEFSLGMPDKIRSIMDERFAQLPESARLVAEAASVQGSTFNAHVLHEVTQLPEDEIDTALDRDLMQRHHLVVPSSSRPQDGLYEFQHAVMAEYVYSTMTPRRQLALHKRTAEATLKHFSNQKYAGAAIAAWHFQQANMLPEATVHAVDATFGALIKLDYDLAMVWVERSEQLALDAGDVASLWSARLRRAQTLRGMGQMNEADRLAREAMLQTRRMKQPNLEAQAFDVIALIAFDQGRIVDAIDALEQAIPLYRSCGRIDRISADLSMLSHSTARLGRLDLALDYAEQSWEAAPDPTRDGFGAEALLAKGNALYEMGRYPAALEEYATSQAVYEATGETRGSVLTRMNAGLCMTRLGMYTEAAHLFTRLTAEARNLRTPRLLAYILFYQAQMLEASGDYAAALQGYREALATRREGGLESMAGDDLAGMVRAAMGMGEQVEMRLMALQNWWRSHDPLALEDPLLAMLTFVKAYELLGDERRSRTSLEEGVSLFRRRAAAIEDPEIRETYIRNQPSGRELLELAEIAGLAAVGFD